MASAPGLPNDKDAWQAALDRLSGCRGKGIQATSASKIELEQFLQLGVLWIVRDPSTFENYQHGIPPSILAEAEKELGKLKPWEEYLERVEAKPQWPIKEELGVFALVLAHQQEVNKVVADAAESKVYNLREREEFRYVAEPEVAPTKPKQKWSGGKHDDPTTPIASMAKNMQDLKLTPRTPLGKARDLDVKMFPKAQDEQIVNTALIDFLAALTVHLHCPAKWTLHRKAFKIEGFEARVDGYLKKRGTTDDEIKAIVEVKAAIRNSMGTLSRVRMQEGAQMAAWIFCDEREEGCLIDQEGRRRRILISQDRHQIFLTLAVYGIGYINRLRQADEEDGKVTKTSKPFERKNKNQSKEASKASREGPSGNNNNPISGLGDLLFMNEFGPFNTDDKGRHDSSWEICGSACIPIV